MRLVRTVVGVWLAVAAAAAAEPVLRLGTAERQASLSTFLSIHRDPSAQLSFGQVSDPAFAENFQPNLAERPHFGFTADAVWVRFALQSTAEVPKDWLVELGHPRFERVDWFVVRNGRLAEHLETGVLQPEPVEKAKSRFPVLALTLAPAETVEVYLALRTSAGVEIPINVYSPLDYADHTNHSSVVYLLGFGALGILFLLSFIFAFYTRYPGSLVYSLSIGSVLLLFFGMTGYWAMFRLPGWRFGTTSGLLCFGELTLISLLMYLRRFFETKVRLPRTDRWLQGLQYGCFAFLCYLPFAPYYPMILVVHLQCLVFGLLVQILALMRLIDRDRTARFYLLAWTFFWFLMLLELLKEWKLLPAEVSPGFVSPIALVVSINLFFMALADRVRQMRAESKALQDQMMARLEKLVAERTEELRHAKARAERANEYKRLFLANMSHEIRTPLSALVGLSQAMCKQGSQRNLPADFIRMMEQIRSGGRYLNLMLTNLLDVSAVESGRPRVNILGISLDGWSRSVHDILEPIANAKGVELRWQDKALAGAEWKTDPVRLSQILINLVHNAIKFTPPGGAVIVRFETRPGFFALEVDDAGPGLPVEQGILFEAFQKNMTGVSGADHGVGLGLYVVQTNAQLLSGRVAVEKSASGGARFRVEWSADMKESA